MAAKVEIMEMLLLAMDKEMKLWIEMLPMKELGKVVQGVENKS